MIAYLASFLPAFSLLVFGAGVVLGLVLNRARFRVAMIVLPMVIAFGIFLGLIAYGAQTPDPNAFDLRSLVVTVWHMTRGSVYNIAIGVVFGFVARLSLAFLFVPRSDVTRIESLKESANGNK